jgi:hypothetical protein
MTVSYRRLIRDRIVSLANRGYTESRIESEIERIIDDARETRFRSRLAHRDWSRFLGELRDEFTSMRAQGNTTLIEIIEIAERVIRRKG